MFVFSPGQAIITPNYDNVLWKIEVILFTLVLSYGNKQFHINLYYLLYAFFSKTEHLNVETKCGQNETGMYTTSNIFETRIFFSPSKLHDML